MPLARAEAGLFPGLPSVARRTWNTSPRSWGAWSSWPRSRAYRVVEKPERLSHFFAKFAPVAW